MIRPALTEVGIFLIPFVVYALFLIASRAGLVTPNSWPLHIVAKLAAIAVVLVAISLVLLARFSTEPPNSSYVPAHVENGKFIPGAEK
jgi:uncharacterized membrane protein